MKKLIVKEFEKMKQDKAANTVDLSLYLSFTIRLFVLGFRYFISRIYLRQCDKLGTIVITKQKPKIINKGRIEIGNAVSIWSNITKTRISVHRGGTVIIGNNNFINGAIISAVNKIVIGDNCKFGPFSMILDSDFHEIQDHHLKGKSSEVIIEDNVWIGAKTTILKGVRIGTGSVVAIGAVVTKDVPPNSVVAGVPAKVISIIKRNK